MRRILLAALLLPATALAQPPAREQSLHAFLQVAFADARADYADSTYVSAFADLDGDGRDEALVYLNSGYFCGSGGCNLYVYRQIRGRWRQVSEISIANLPIRLLATRSHGWRDISVLVAGGGVRAHEARLSYNGRSYPSNPSVPPAATLRGRAAGRPLIAEETPGRPLFR